MFNTKTIGKTLLWWTYLSLGLWPQFIRAEQDVSILTPPGCLPADGGPGYPIYIYTGDQEDVNRSISIKADLGRFQSIQAFKSGLVRAQYLPPRIRKQREIHFAATYQVAGLPYKEIKRVTLCPYPVGRIWIRSKPKKLLAGKQEKSLLSIRALDDMNKPIEGGHLEITTNVGRVGKIEEIGNGEYRSYYYPPNDPYPQVAIIMVANPRLAKLDRVAAARAVIPITANIEVPGKTSPHTKMQMTVAGKKFGPVKADEKGRFKIPIKVPPGYGKGKATSIDQVGNQDIQWIDLFLPETNQLGLWGYPRLLPADGRSKSRLLVTTIDPFGITGDFSLVRIEARYGRVGAIKNIGRGFYEAYYTAPKSVGIGKDTLEATFPEGGKKSRAVYQIRLLPGPTDQISIDVPKILPADGLTLGKVIVSVEDARGNPVGNQKVSLTSSVGELSELQEISLGKYEAHLSVPSDVGQWTCTLQTKVLDQLGGKPKKILIVPESLIMESDGRVFLTPVLVDRSGRPVEGAKVELWDNGNNISSKTGAFGRARIELTTIKNRVPQTCILSASDNTIRKLVYWVREEKSARLLPIGLDSVIPPDQPLEHNASVQIHPPIPIDLKLTATHLSVSDNSWLIKATLTDSKGEPSLGRKILFSASAGELGQVREIENGVYQVEFDASQVHEKQILVTALDNESRVGAVIKISTEKTGDGL